MKHHNSCFQAVVSFFFLFYNKSKVNLLNQTVTLSWYKKLIVKTSNKTKNIFLDGYKYWGPSTETARDLNL